MRLHNHVLGPARNPWNWKPLVAVVIPHAARAPARARRDGAGDIEAQRRRARHHPRPTVLNPLEPRLAVYLSSASRQQRTAGAADASVAAAAEDALSSMYNVKAV